MVKILIPPVLQRLTEGKSHVSLEAGNISEIIEKLESNFPGTKKLIAPNGEVQKFINIYINGEDIRFQQNEKTSVKENDEVNIVLAVSGG